MWSEKQYKRPWANLAETKASFAICLCLLMPQSREYFSLQIRRLLPQANRLADLPIYPRQTRPVPFSLACIAIIFTSSLVNDSRHLYLLLRKYLVPEGTTSPRCFDALPGSSYHSLSPTHQSGWRSLSVLFCTCIEYSHHSHFLFQILTSGSKFPNTTTGSSSLGNTFPQHSESPSTLPTCSYIPLSFLETPPFGTQGPCSVQSGKFLSSHAT